MSTLFSNEQWLPFRCKAKYLIHNSQQRQSIVYRLLDHRFQVQYMSSCWPTPFAAIDRYLRRYSDLPGWWRCCFSQSSSCLSTLALSGWIICHRFGSSLATLFSFAKTVADCGCFTVTMFSSSSAGAGLRSGFP